MQGVNVFENGIGYLRKCLGLYTAGTGYFMLYVLAVIVILIKGSKRERELFIPGAVALLVTVYNPLSPVILDKIFDVSSEYYRLFWIAPVIILVPYMAVKLIYDMPSKAGRAAVAVAVSASLLLGGNYIYAKGFTAASNIYKMDDELIEIDGIIRKDCGTEYTRAFFEYEYNMEIRQYDPKILLVADREDYIYAVSYSYTDEMLEDEQHKEYRILALLVRNQKVKPEELADALDSTDTQYVILTKGHPQESAVKKAGLYPIAETKMHTVYKFDLSDPYPFELLDYSDVEHRFSYRRLK